MKSDSGREHDWYFLVLVGMRGNFEGTRNRVIDGCSRGGGRRLCKEDVGWIVDLNNSLCGSVCRTIILVVVFSQFLRRLQVNFCVRIDGRWEERGFPFFGVFAVILRHVTPNACLSV